MNTSYLAVWVGIPVAAAAILIVLAFTVFRGNQTGCVITTLAGKPGHALFERQAGD